MNWVSGYRKLFVFPILFLALSCARSHHVGPSMLQLCFDDERGIDELIGVLEEIASDNSLGFVDRSSGIQREMRTLGMDPGYRVIGISVTGEDGVGLAAGNLSLGPYQAVVGFTQGADAEASEAFAKDAIATLEGKWKLRPVASGQGASKLPDCR